ncbi:MAG: hypothetical protein B6U97_04425 [Candidatus Altiarchaeales archaeon ex4484_96]|nr:MAG: hypothetical protein B6U97_04425 [Candidatus Altiarchaeales archaeon ex4484_96]
MDELEYLDSLIVLALILASGLISLEVGIAVPILEVLAGILGGNLLHIEFSQPLQYLSYLGLISLMYLAGLEVDLKIMKENLRKSGCIGIPSYLLPAAVVSAVAYLLIPPLQNNPKQSIITGIILSTTSLAIVYPILKESKFMQTPVGKTILGGAAFTEILAMITLSFFFLDYSNFTLLLFLTLVLSIFTLPDFSKKLLNRYHDELPEIELRFILLLLLGMSTLSEIANVEIAITAFFLGVITSEVIKDYSQLEKKLRTLTFGFLSPFFFLEVGLDIKPEYILPNLGLILTLLLVGYTTKYLGTNLFARKNIPTHAGYISHLFNMPMPLGLLFAVLAFNQGIYTQSTYASMVIVILAASIISSYSIGRKRCGLDMVCDIY